MSDPERDRAEAMIEGVYSRLATLSTLSERIAEQQREQIDKVRDENRLTRRALLYATFGFLATALAVFAIAIVVVVVVQ